MKVSNINEYVGVVGPTLSARVKSFNRVLCLIVLTMALVQLSSYPVNGSLVHEGQRFAL